MADALWYWHRLHAMDAKEMGHRFIEKIRRVTEPLARSAIKDVRLTQVPAECPSLPSRDDAPALLKQTLASDAAKLLDGKWSLFGWKEAQVTSPPDWHRDHMREVSVPMDGKLNHRSLPGGADVRTIWEINRWAEPVRLAMHGWLNDDAAAISRAQSWLADWVEKNPVGHGINWTSALEGGLRLINFCWFDALASQMVDSRLKIGETQRVLRNQIAPAHVWWVHRYLSFGSSANNHRLGELTGLLLAVKRWPELERIAGTAEDIWKQIAECVLAQFAEDGGNREQALHYHLFAFEMALHACRAMNMTDPPVIERLQRAAEFFVRMSHPHEPWDYGDNDDAQIVPLTIRRKKAVAEWCAWMNGETEGDALALSFWLGDSPIRNPQPAIRNRDWWIARESGMAVIERDGWKVRVDASPLGYGKMAAHGHCDALHVSIWDGELALVIDPGTGGYFGNERAREALRCWQSHNGPIPADEGKYETPKGAGCFLQTHHHPHPELALIHEEIAGKISHEGYRFERRIRFVAGGIDILDHIEKGEGFMLWWRFAPECIVEQGEDALGTQFVLRRGQRQWLFRFEGSGLIFTSRADVSRSFGSFESGEGLTIGCTSSTSTVSLRRN